MPQRFFSISGHANLDICFRPRKLRKLSQDDNSQSSLKLSCHGKRGPPYKALICLKDFSISGRINSNACLRSSNLWWVSQGQLFPESLNQSRNRILGSPHNFRPYKFERLFKVEQSLLSVPKTGQLFPESLKNRAAIEYVALPTYLWYHKGSFQVQAVQIGAFIKVVQTLMIV